MVRCRRATRVPIESDAQLAGYKSYYLSIGDCMDQYPNKIFMVGTQPPQVRFDTDGAIAARARVRMEWLQSAEYLAGHPKVFVFNLFGLLADGDNVLCAEYRADEHDSRPKELANRTIGPLFADFIDPAVRTYTAP